MAYQLSHEKSDFYLLCSHRHKRAKTRQTAKSLCTKSYELEQIRDVGHRTHRLRAIVWTEVTRIMLQIIQRMLIRDMYFNDGHYGICF